MADLAGLAAAGEAPAERVPPEPPQLPYAADPGTLTHWLVTDMDILTVIVSWRLLRL